ncbi:CFI-box-CTERM domain-containing protein [uncultured Methylibium sp.]|uniref:CFI-box-CTERM domain-containing protein n=1 Tax=uncultured Methylibium sp. TaxID=381093 RepID=UPI0034530DA1
MARRRKTKDAVSASALSQMGVCERLVVFEHLHGKRPTLGQRAALRRGLRAHRQFLSEGVSHADRVGRCFIATHVFGEGPETQVLRRFRDQYLRPTRAGRRLILAYYRLAPSVCRATERWPMTRPAVTAAMRPLVWFAERLLAGQAVSHVSD